MYVQDTRVNPKIREICPFKKKLQQLLAFTTSFEVVPLGTVANSAQGDYFEGDGEN
jgi:hypothetical protein